MNFFEFNDYEYYALIVADSEEKAVLGYEETVGEIFEEEKESSPDVITVEEALERYKKGMIEGCETIDEKIQDFYKNIDNFKEYVSKGTGQYLVLLIDGSLIWCSDIDFNSREEAIKEGMKYAKEDRGSGKVEDMQRRNIIVRLEKCRNKNKEFYNKYPDLLKELDYKIEALKNGADYKIEDANWTVAYVGGKLRDTNIGFKETNRGLIEYKDTMTIEIAKEVYSKFRENPHFKNRK